MDLFVLSSGSCGNCVFVRSGNTRILVDAGIPARTTKHLLSTIGESIDDIDGLLITHDHRDHMKSAEILARRHHITVHITDQTLAGGAHLFPRAISADSRAPFRSGDRFRIGTFDVESIPTPHDASDPVGFLIDDGSRRLGVFTDLGHVPESLRELVPTLDAMMLEANYDEQMLEEGPYPAYLKTRIRGPRGHLSNDDAGTLLRDHGSDRLRTVVLSHLSEDNNRPETAFECVRRCIDASDIAPELIVAHRGMPTKKMIV